MVMVDNSYRAQNDTKEHRQENDTNLRRLFRLASARGPIPGIICMDANRPLDTDPVLKGILHEYGWRDAAEMQAERDGVRPQPTYPLSTSWDDPDHLTRPDGVFLNSEAAKMSHFFWVTATALIRQHKQLHVTLRADLYDAPITVLKRPAPYPVATRTHMTELEEWDLGEVVLRKHGEHLQSQIKGPNRNSTVAFESISIMWEDYMDRRHLGAEGTPAGHGRERPPRLKVTSLAARASTAADSVQAEDARLKRLRKMEARAAAWEAQVKTELKKKYPGARPNHLPPREEIEVTKDGELLWAACKKKIQEGHIDDRVGDLFLNADPPRTWAGARSLRTELRERAKRERDAQRCVKIGAARGKHRAGAGTPVAANYRFVKGEGPPPVTHLPDPEAEGGATSEPARMHDLTYSAWMKVYRTWEGIGPPEYGAWKEQRPPEARERLVAHACPLPPITGEMLYAQLRRAKYTTSTGTDSWRAAECKLLPPNLLEPMAQLFNEIEAGAEWPRGLLYAITALLAKAGQDPLTAGPLKQRPVTVASVLYRRYSSLRYKHLCAWMEKWLHPNFRGGVPGGECRDLTLEVGLDLEEAALEQEPLWGMNEDVFKCYDSLVRRLLFGAAKDLGCPPGFVESQARFYDPLYRAFKCDRAIGRWWQTTGVSILQGCALAQIWVNVDGSAWAWGVEAKAKVKVGGFIDDKQLRAKGEAGYDEVQKGADASTKYHANPGQTLEVTKSKGWCSIREEKARVQPISINGTPLGWVDADKVLGVENQYTGNRTRPEQRKRCDAALAAAERLGRLPVGWELKDLLAGLAVVTKYTYGAENHGDLKCDTQTLKRHIEIVVRGPMHQMRAPELLWTLALNGPRSGPE